MKISRPTLAILVGIAVILIVSVMYLYNRSLARIEQIAVAEIKAKMEKKALAELEKQKVVFEEKQREFMRAAELAGRAYSQKSQESEANRRKADEARRANASINASWEIKYGKLDGLYKQTLDDWKLSDDLKDKAIKGQVEALNGIIERANTRIVDLEQQIGGVFGADGKLIKPGYIQTLADTRARLALAQRKARRNFINGLLIGSIGGIGISVGMRVL